MKHVIGGTVCGCGCCYAGQGGSSTDDNGAANFAGGLHSPGCENEPYVVLEEIVIPG